MLLYATNLAVVALLVLLHIRCRFRYMYSHFYYYCSGASVFVFSRHRRRCGCCCCFCCCCLCWCLCFGFCAKVAKTPSALSVAEVCRTLRICMRVSLSLTILVPPPYRIAAIVHTNRLGEKGWPYKTWSLHIRIHVRAARVLVQNIVAKSSRVRRYAGHPMKCSCTSSSSEDRRPIIRVVCQSFDYYVRTFYRRNFSVCIAIKIPH